MVCQYLTVYSAEGHGANCTWARRIIWKLRVGHPSFQATELEVFCLNSGTSVRISIPSGVAGDFFPKVPTEPCALGSTQPLKMSTRILLGVKTAGAYE
jgi:hypothetical protein